MEILLSDFRITHSASHIPVDGIRTVLAGRIVLIADFKSLRSHLLGSVVLRVPKSSRSSQCQLDRIPNPVGSGHHRSQIDTTNIRC